MDGDTVFAVFIGTVVLGISFAAGLLFGWTNGETVESCAIIIVASDRVVCASGEGVNTPYIRRAAGGIIATATPAH